MKSSGLLQERHVLMAIGLGMEASTIQQRHRSAPEAKDLLLLEWVEDLYFAQFGTYSPVDETATPESQMEDPARHSLMLDTEAGIEKLIAQRQQESEMMDDLSDLEDTIERLERETPVSYGEISEEDGAMLHRQENFRTATRSLSQIPAVRKVVFFGSNVLPLWKEVPRFSRLRRKRIKIFHEVRTIDMAVWVKKPFNADQMRKTIGKVVNDLVAKEIHLNVASHHFCLHLVEESAKLDAPGQGYSGRYLGMVCHFKNCPSHKQECMVKGCGGAIDHVQILPWFNLKPQRLNNHNSQLLYDADAKG